MANQLFDDIKQVEEEAGRRLAGAKRKFDDTIFKSKQQLEAESQMVNVLKAKIAELESNW